MDTQNQQMREGFFAVIPHGDRSPSIHLHAQWSREITNSSIEQELLQFRLRVRGRKGISLDKSRIRIARRKVMASGGIVKQPLAEVRVFWRGQNFQSMPVNQALFDGAA